MEKGQAKRRDVGVVGGLVIAVQALSSLHSSDVINQEMQRQIDQLKTRQEEFFVRKSEMSAYTSKMSKQMTELKDEMVQLKTMFRNSEFSFQENEELDGDDPPPRKARAVIYGSRRWQ